MEGFSSPRARVGLRVDTSAAGSGGSRRTVGS